MFLERAGKSKIPLSNADLARVFYKMTKPSIVGICNWRAPVTLF